MTTNYLARDFPEIATELAELRMRDATFAEICRDYSVIAAELESAGPQQDTDTAEILKGLADEIRRRLAVLQRAEP